MHYAYWLLLALLSITSAHAGDIAMKEIRFRGGLVSFSIPKHWVEESERDTTGLFYADVPDSGALRLDVITYKLPKPLSKDAAFEELKANSRLKSHSIQRLKNGNAIATAIERASDQGTATTLFWWHVTNPVHPDHVRLANFSYTVPTSREGTDTVKREVQMLTESIKNAKFHPTIGQY